MRLKFTRAVAAGRGIFHKGEVAEVPSPAAETYIAHGYAEAVPGGAADAAPVQPRAKKPVTEGKAPGANSQ